MAPPRRDRSRPERTAVAAAGGEWVVPAAEAGRRLDAFLAAQDRLQSRGRVRRAIERGKVILNDRDVLPEQSGALLAPGDRVRLWVDRPGSARVRRRRVDSTGRALPVVYEDAAIIVVNKPPGLLTVPLGSRAGAPSAEDLVATYLRSKGRRRPCVVHRIDRDTSGLVIFATNPSARDALKAQFVRREPERVYLAVVAGTPDPPRGVWRDHMRWDPAGLVQVATDPGDSRGRECVSEYHVLESLDSGRAALVRVELRTGRRNQIRVQAQQHGHPLLGERMYADEVAGSKGQPVLRQALHAWRLRFSHPETGRPVSVEAPIPQDFLILLSRLRGDSGGDDANVWNNRVEPNVAGGAPDRIRHSGRLKS